MVRRVRFSSNKLFGDQEYGSTKASLEAAAAITYARIPSSLSFIAVNHAAVTSVNYHSVRFVDH